MPFVATTVRLPEQMNLFEPLIDRFTAFFDGWFCPRLRCLKQLGHSLFEIALRASVAFMVCRVSYALHYVYFLVVWAFVEVFDNKFLDGLPCLVNDNRNVHY